MNPELAFYLRSLAKCVYFVTDEEDRFLLRFQQVLSKQVKRTWVFNAALGLQPIEAVTKDWSTRAHAENRDCANIHDALIRIYRDDPREEQNFYIITDPERWLRDDHVQRRVLNVVHQLHNNIRTVKILIFVGSRLLIPEKLQRYFEVVHDKGLTDTEIEEIVTETCGYLKRPAFPNAAKVFGGLTSFEIRSSIAQSVIKTKKDPVDPRRIDPEYVAEFRRRQLTKTDLLSYVDTKEFNFDVVGGVERFKAWTRKMRATWTEKGRAFGLKPPRGVLAVGVWGCGKSLSVKAMGHAWQLPVVQMEMGRLRSSGVGESEANVYRATRIIESVAPCIVWLDEADKSLSGTASSSQSDAGTTSRTVGILSTWLQETRAPVCLAMTANSLTSMPVEFVNRMDERFFFDMPNEEERIEIVKIHLRKVGADPDDYDLALLAEASHRMVGREIEQAIAAAMVESFAQDKPKLDQDILQTELESKPRIHRTMVDELQELIEWVGYDPEAKEGIRARFASRGHSESLRLISTDG